MTRILEVDRILTGTVVPLDGRHQPASALAIADGRIVAVGSREDVLDLAGPRTEVFDFPDAAIVPGFNDTHAHMDTEGLKLMRPSLADCRSIDDVVARIKALANERTPGQWIVTMPVGKPPYYFGGPAALAENRMPTRDELDRAAPDHPVCILPPSGYWGSRPCYCALNSRGLQLNGIDRHTTPRVANLTILKDERGEPTGVVEDENPRESAQLDLLPAVPRFTHDERHEGIRLAIQRYHAEGITSIYEGHGCSPEVIGIYRHLWEADALSMRVGMVVNPPWETVADAETIMRDWLVYARGQGVGDSRFRISGVHISYGGDPVATALAHAQGHDTGYWSHLWQANDPRTFEELCTAAARCGLRVHTIASAGNQEHILPVFERIGQQIEIPGRRWVVEHLSLCREDDLRAIKRLGLGVTLIPASHLWKNGSQYLHLSEAERDLVAPAKQLHRMGIPFAAGTDNAPSSPLAVMQAMMLRADRTTGTTIGAGGQVSADVALGVLTHAGAWFTFEEHGKGRLTPGSHADCAILSADPLTTEPEQLTDLSVLATMVGGEFVFGP